MNEIIQLKITLKGTKPPIWRRVLVNKKRSFEELHNIIQVAMGWQDEHLYEFVINDCIIEGSFQDDFGDFFDVGQGFFGKRYRKLKALDVSLDSMITREKEKFTYTYDFGDDWSHQVLVEKFLPRDPNLKYPVCIGGKLNCPPEDCGGVPGYYYLLEVLKNKKHPDHKGMLEYLGERFDPNYFDKEEINKVLCYE